VNERDLRPAGLWSPADSSEIGSGTALAFMLEASPRAKVCEVTTDIHAVPRQPSHSHVRRAPECAAARWRWAPDDHNPGFGDARAEPEMLEKNGGQGEN
jgi:hypothetical protein